MNQMLSSRAAANLRVPYATASPARSVTAKPERTSQPQPAPPRAKPQAVSPAPISA